MNLFQPASSPPLLIDIRQHALTVLDESSGPREFSLERQPNGRLTETCIAQVSAGIRDHLRLAVRAGARHAICAIDARGVSIRRLQLPGGTGDWERLLPLQIESEFPLPPEALAWTAQRKPAPASTGATQDCAVAAVRREVVGGYVSLLADIGITSSFTLGAFARAALLMQPAGRVTLLHMESGNAELLALEDGLATQVRTVPLPSGSAAAAEALGKLLTTGRVYVSGSAEWLLRLRELAGSNVVFESLPNADQPTSTLAGLRRSLGRDGTCSLPLLRSSEPARVNAAAGPDLKRWVALACLLALCALALRYAEGWIQQPRVARALAKWDAQKAALPELDREISLLQFLDQNRPPYLEALTVLANAAPMGTRIESVNMSRRGDMSWRCAFQSSQQVTDFRSKLAASEFFSSVVVEEQTPTPDRRLNVRMNAQWKPSTTRPRLPAPAVPEKPAAPGAAPVPAGASPPGGAPATPAAFPKGSP